MKKIISALLFLSALVLPASGLAATYNTPPFSDVPLTHPNFIAISELKAKGVISGYPDGTFKPDQPINRVEALKIIMLGAGFTAEAGSSTLLPTPSFKDIDQTQWYMPYLREAVSSQIVAGYPDGTFKPTQTVNLVENLKMVILANKVDLTKITLGTSLYADTPLDQWYAKYVQYAKNYNLIDADSSNNVHPDQPMTRGKMAEIMYRQMTAAALNNPNPTPAPAENSVTYQVSIKGMAFSPKDLLVPVGTTVRWTNNDPMAHTVTFDDSSLSSSSSIPSNGTFDETFTKQGTFSYHCSIHPSMTGTITVKPAIEVPTI